MLVRPKTNFEKIRCLGGGLKRPVNSVGCQQGF